MKLVRVLIAAIVVLPAPLAAQQPTPQQPPVNPITQTFRASGAQYARWLTAAFDSIPADKYAYRPTPVQLTIGYVAQHLENANYLLCARFGGMTHPTTARDSLADTIKAKWPKDTLTARLKASFAFCDKAMATLDDAKLSEQVPVGFPPGDRTIDRARYVLGYVTDLVDHWSQIANYMRLNGLVPPSALPRPGARGGE